MLVVGLTGGIATGKSTVSSLLAKHRYPIIDADVLAREVVEPGTRGHAAIHSVFGDEVFLPDGRLDRAKLGQIIFNDEHKRKQLNGIIHPAVRRALLWKVIRYWLKGERVCILDIPLLIETGLWRTVGLVVLVYCPRDLQLARLMSRDVSKRDAAVARVNSQMPISDKVPYADVVLDNSGSKAELESQLLALEQRLQRHAGWSSQICRILPPVGVAFAIVSLIRHWLRSLSRPQPIARL